MKWVSAVQISEFPNVQSAKAILKCLQFTTSAFMYIKEKKRKCWCVQNASPSRKKKIENKNMRRL